MSAADLAAIYCRAILLGAQEGIIKMTTNTSHAFADQEFLHDPATGVLGDCWRAGIASVLGRPIAEIPHFVRDYPDPEGATVAAWFAETCRWLTKHHGVTILFYDRPDAVRAECRTEPSAFPHILIDGRSPRFGGTLAHVVVGDAITGDIVHDPHPSRAGLITITGAFVLTPVIWPCVCSCARHDGNCDGGCGCTIYEADRGTDGIVDDSCLGANSVPGVPRTRGHA